MVLVSQASPSRIQPDWKKQRKHIFIFSDAGKPIFSLHGEDEEVASLTALMQALVIPQNFLAITNI